MLRFKTYDATGLAPNGRLYAGDLNLLQDLVAALADFTQNLQVGSIAIANTDVLLSRFGVGEGAFNSKLRVSGIFRALSGFISGTYTTGDRDAIALGGAPYGLVILNTTTNRLEINLGTDVARNWQPMSQPVLRGTAASRPAATAANINQLYFSTDLNGGTLSYSDGSVWTKIAPGLTETPTIPAGTITVGMLAFDVATQAELDTHVAAADPHPGYRLESAAITSADIANGTIVPGDADLTQAWNFTGNLQKSGMRVHRHPYGTDRHIESGSASVSSSGPVGISFTDAFGSVPFIAVSNTGGGSTYVDSPTGSGANLGVSTWASSGGTAYWIAEGAE